MVVVRDGKNLKGRILGFVLGTIGRRVLEKAFENSVKAIEVRHKKLNLRPQAFPNSPLEPSAGGLSDGGLADSGPNHLDANSVGGCVGNPT